MGWFQNPDAANAENSQEKPNVEAGAKPPEKTAAELIAEQFGPLKDTLTNLVARLDSIEENTKKPPVRVENPEMISVLDNEDAAFAQRVGPVMLRQFEIEARIVRDEIRREYTKAGYGEVWEQFEDKINKVLEGTPVVRPDGKAWRGDPDYIRNTVDMIFGRAAREAGIQFGGKSKGFFLESTSGATGESRVPENDGLSNDQRRVMGRMKISADDMKKVMAKLKFVS